MKATSKGRIKIILKGLALVLWCVVIFMFSANNADESNKQSDAVFNTVIEFVNPVYDSLDTTAQAEYKDTATFIIRKLAHFSEYALLGILAFINFSKVKKLGYRGLFAAVFSCIYASSDEIHQLFVPGRAGQVRDVLIDTSGAVAGILLAILRHKRQGSFTNGLWRKGYRHWAGACIEWCYRRKGGKQKRGAERLH